MITEAVLVGNEDNFEDVAEVVGNANVVGVDEDKVSMDRTVQKEEQLQIYIVEVDNT